MSRQSHRFLMFVAAIAILCMVVLPSFAIAQLTAATIDPSAVAEDPVQARVSVYVLNVGKFEVATGSYTVDFYLDFQCDRPCTPDRFEFMNGRATSIDKLIDTPTEKFYRIQAALSTNVDLRQYPFDHNALTIEIEDKNQTLEHLEYQADYAGSGIDPSVIIVGWQLDGWNATTQEHFYAPYDETYSRYIFQLYISRVTLTSVLKSFLPVFFMVLVALLTLLLRADKLTTRLSLNISTLLAAVLFHVNLTNSIPPVGYLTFADKFMLSTYVILILVLFSGILLMRHTDAKDETMASKIYHTALYALPALTLIIYAILFILL